MPAMRALIALVALAAALAAPQEFETVGGKSISLADLLQRGPVVLVFWNSWLPQGKSFLPLLREVESSAQREGWPGAVVIFQDDSADGTKLLASEPAVLPRVLDRRGVLVRHFEVTRAPAVLLVDRDGTVMARSGPGAEEVRAVLRQMAKR
jgi:thiol-disulfide isomerase/thioredoxin